MTRMIIKEESLMIFGGSAPRQVVCFCQSEDGVLASTHLTQVYGDECQHKCCQHSLSSIYRYTTIKDAMMKRKIEWKSCTSYSEEEYIQRHKKPINEL